MLLVSSGHAQTAQSLHNNKAAAESSSYCEPPSNGKWYPTRGFFYTPVKTLYNVDWDICTGDDLLQRVRVIDANEKKVFFEYEDAQVLRLEEIDLLNNHLPELLIITTNPGTADAEDWHIVGEHNGKLQEWKHPDYDSSSAELLGRDEEFGKDWNFHLRGNEIFLARGIYHKGLDGNCCPSRGGILVHLHPIANGFDLAKVERISKTAYHYWERQPFCFRCTLLRP